MNLLKASGAIYSGTWRAKFPILPVDLEHSGKSCFLLMLQTRDLKFLEHSFFAKNVAKSPNIGKLSPKYHEAPPGIKLTTQPQRTNFTLKLS